MVFGFFTLLGLSSAAEAKAPLEYLDGLYLGAGMQYQKSDDESDTPLAFDIRYAPAQASSLRPYGRFIWTSAARPTDGFRYSLPSSESTSPEDIPGWRLNILDFQLGVEMDIPSELFVRAGIAGMYSSEAAAGPVLVEELDAVMDFSTVTRAGIFAAAGKRLELDSMQLETSLNLTHVRGLTVGGEDTVIGDCPDGDFAWEELCDRSRSDFASSITRLAVDNHMNIGPVAMAGAVFYGQVHSSKFTEELAEGDTSNLNPSFYGAHLTVGYEFGAGEREPRAAKSKSKSKTKRAPTAAIQMTGIKEFDDLFMQAKAIQDRVVALRMKLAEGRAAFAGALGASPDTDISILADQARGSLMSSISVSMARGVPSFSARAGAPPEAKQAAAGLSTMAETAEETTKEMAKLKDDVMALINDAQAFPGQAPSAAQAALKDGSIKFMEVPKVPKKVVGNVKAMSGLPKEIAGLAADAASTAAVLGSLAGS